MHLTAPLSVAFVWAPDTDKSLYISLQIWNAKGMQRNKIAWKAARSHNGYQQHLHGDGVEDRSNSQAARQDNVYRL